MEGRNQRAGPKRSLESSTYLNRGPSCHFPGLFLDDETVPSSFLQNR